ncbi:MAG: polysaccharide biosynthesis/export family protein [Ferruginibacter sp.]
MPYKKKSNKIISRGLIAVCACFLFSCQISKNVTKEDFLYFQTGLDSIKKIQVTDPIIHVNDLIAVQISSSSLNQEQTIPFNMQGSASTAGYLVNTAGNIDMPVLGSVKAAGLTQDQLQKVVIEKLLSYVKDPIVIVHFLQFKVNVLGEVRSPGMQKFEVDRVTLLDALSSAGDLSDNGKREDITVIREEGGSRKIYKVDIRSGSMFQSPAFVLQSNDIVYVGPNFKKFKDFKSSNTNNSQNVLRIFTTIISLFTSIIVIIRVFK